MDTMGLLQIMFDNKVTVTPRDRRYINPYIRRIGLDGRSMTQRVFVDQIQATPYASKSKINFQDLNYREINIPLDYKIAGTKIDIQSVYEVDIPFINNGFYSISNAIELATDQLILDLLHNATGVIDIPKDGSNVGFQFGQLKKATTALDLAAAPEGEDRRIGIIRADGWNDMIEWPQTKNIDSLNVTDISNPNSVESIFRGRQIPTYMSTTFAKVADRREGGIWTDGSGTYEAYIVPWGTVIGARGRLHQTFEFKQSPDSDDYNLWGRAHYCVGMILPEIVARIKYATSMN